MKNIIIIISLVVAMPAMAQIPKGTSTIGGGISLSRENTDYTTESDLVMATSKYKATKLSLSPGYGYFVVNNFCVGLNLNTAFTHSKSTLGSETGTSNTRTLGVGPFVRYYIPFNSTLYAYGAAGYSRLWNKIDSDTYDPIDGYSSSRTTRSKSGTIDIGLGLSWFINPNTAIEGGMLFTHEGHDENEDKLNTLALNIGLRIFLRKSE